jgi:hypothetical protein
MFPFCMERNLFILLFKYSAMKIRYLLIACLFFDFYYSIAQINTTNSNSEESKIFEKNSLEVLQAAYLDKDGMPSYEIFLQKNSLNPFDKKSQSTPFFTISISKDDFTEKNGKVEIKNSATFLNLDFYVTNTLTFKSFNKAVPIRDGRVYEEKNQIIIGGYSDKHNERPIGFIDEKGKFNAANDLDSTIFPLLKTPSDDLLFDPFKKRLSKIDSSNGIEQSTRNQHFLPIDLYSNKGALLHNMQFKIINQRTNSSLTLVAIVNGEQIEIARCNTQTSKLVNRRDAFQPALITGASQQKKGEMVSLTFKGTYANAINLKEGQLFLNVKGKDSNNSKKTSDIEIDGDFQDWRNISGISDVQGDYVSYLFKNPDTDLLEFKVTNDDKYLYFYSRVVGAHGRTGEKGRYYWYTYIDVDQNPTTGYPPTRDDNCYFGIAIGDDCEAQFEFIGNKFIKTFFGFTGMGAEEEILSGALELGPSYYSRTDKNGNKRDRYKMEYVHRENARFITEDYTEGTSEDILISLSPDGSEVEVKVELSGFLKDKYGKKLVQRGQKIDIAVGVEGSSKHYGSDLWGADSSAVIYGYLIK